MPVNWRTDRLWVLGSLLLSPVLPCHVYISTRVFVYIQEGAELSPWSLPPEFPRTSNSFTVDQRHPPPALKDRCVHPFIPDPSTLRGGSKSSVHNLAFVVPPPSSLKRAFVKSCTACLCFLGPIQWPTGNRPLLWSTFSRRSWPECQLQRGATVSMLPLAIKQLSVKACSVNVIILSTLLIRSCTSAVLAWVSQGEQTQWLIPPRLQR